MKIAEKNNPKEELREKSDAYKAAIQHEVKELGDRTSRALVNVAVVAGSVGVAYLVYRGFASRSKSKSAKARRKGLIASTEERPELHEESRFAAILGNVATVFATQAAAFLLTFARQKLIDYLKEDSERNSGKNQQANQ